MPLTCHTAKSQCLTLKDPVKYTNKLIKKTTDTKLQRILADKHLALCRFPRLAIFPMLEYKYIFQIKIYTEAALSDSTRKLLGLRFEITKILMV